MRIFFSLLLVCLSFFYSKASSLVNGYIILPNGDTLVGQIKFGGFRQATNWEEVTFVDNAGVETKYKAQKGEVKGYGIESFGIKKDFIYFELKPKANSRWFERIYTGAAYSLYGSSVTGSFGTVDVTSIWYVLQKPSGEFQFLETCGICPWRKNLSTFLAEDADALTGLEEVKAKELGKYLKKICR